MPPNILQFQSQLQNESSFEQISHRNCIHIDKEGKKDLLPSLVNRKCTYFCFYQHAENNRATCGMQTQFLETSSN